MPATETTIETIASEASTWFERRTRGDEGESFTTLKDDAPEWVRDMVYEAHGDFGPEDWRYECIRAAVDWLADGNDPDEVGEFADDQVDIYTGRRLAWLASNLNRPGYVDEAVEELGHSDQGIVGDIGLGQYGEAAECFGLVYRQLEARLETVTA